MAHTFNPKTVTNVIRSLATQAIGHNGECMGKLAAEEQSTSTKARLAFGVGQID